MKELRDYKTKTENDIDKALHLLTLTLFFAGSAIITWVFWGINPVIASLMVFVSGYVLSALIYSSWQSDIPHLYVEPEVEEYLADVEDEAFSDLSPDY